MGWAYYMVGGHECGYAVSALCDSEYCFEPIDRGLGYLCGLMPGGDEAGCGGYFCSEHQHDHNCPAEDPS